MPNRSRRTTVVVFATAFTALLSGCAPRRTPVNDAAPPATGAASSPKSSTATVPEGSGKSMAELFRGKFPGVDVTEVPGRGIRVRIRNSGGLGPGDPLYVVNGTPIETPDGTLYIDPNTITKIEIADVASSSLYGIRGANGVVKITTKK